MKRLVRSLGSSKTTSRVGFYATLTAFLLMHPELSIDKFLSIVDNELHPANSNSKSVRKLIYLV